MSPRVWARARKPVGFAEVPDFHVAVARRADPSLITRPVLVGGDPEKRGKVLASSAELRALGISAGMSLSEALDRAPDAAWVETDMARAREVSGLFRAAIRRELEAIEMDGLGAFYWEVTGTREDFAAVAQRIEQRLREATELCLRIGVAPIRFAARWAAEDADTRCARVVDESELDAYLLKQPIERFPGVGPKTAARLAELGASNVVSLRSLGLERLEILFGPRGRTLWMYACGEDPTPLRVRRHPATLSREKSFSASGRGAVEVAKSLERLAESLGSALLREGLGAGRIALRLTVADRHPMTRSLTLPDPVSSGAELCVAARELWFRAAVDVGSVRKLAIVVAGLEILGADERQLGLFQTQ